MFNFLYLSHRNVMFDRLVSLCFEVSIWVVSFVLSYFDVLFWLTSIFIEIFGVYIDEFGFSDDSLILFELFLL